MRKVENIQAVRGFAVLLVMCFHLRTIETKYLSGETVLPDYLFGGIAGVDLFFVVSGFIMASITKSGFGQPAGIVSFIYNRGTRIYPLYWIYSLPVLGLFLVRPDLVNPSQGSQANILASFLLVPQSLLPLLMVGWTLILEVYFYAVIAFFLLAPERLFVGLLGVWVVLVVGGRLLIEDPSAFLRCVTHLMTLEFIAGCLVALFFDRLAGRLGRLALAAGLVLLFGGWAAYRSTQPPLDPWGWREDRALRGAESADPLRGRGDGTALGALAPPGAAIPRGCLVLPLSFAHARDFGAGFGVVQGRHVGAAVQRAGVARHLRRGGRVRACGVPVPRTTAARVLQTTPGDGGVLGRRRVTSGNRKHERRG